MRWIEAKSTCLVYIEFYFKILRLKVQNFTSKLDFLATFGSGSFGVFLEGKMPWSFTLKLVFSVRDTNYEP